jgi:hypothetical protein
MSKSKVNIKKNYEIKKVKRVMRVREENYVPATFEVYKVTGPNKFKKYFVSRKDAKAYIDKMTDNKMLVVDAFREIQRLANMKLPIKTINTI